MRLERGTNKTEVRWYQVMPDEDSIFLTQTETEIAETAYQMGVQSHPTPPDLLLTEYVIGFLFNDKCEVALIRKNRPEWQRGKWNGIGGHIERGETPLQAMQREFKEETGADAKWHFYCAMTFEKAIVHCFWSDSEVEIQTTTDEEVAWHEAGELPFNIIPNLSWLVPMALWREIEPYTISVEFRENFTHSQPLIEQKERRKIGEWLEKKGDEQSDGEKQDLLYGLAVELNKSGEPLEGGKG